MSELATPTYLSHGLSLVSSNHGTSCGTLGCQSLRHAVSLSTNVIWHHVLRISQLWQMVVVAHIARPVRMAARASHTACSPIHLSANCTVSSTASCLAIASSEVLFGSIGSASVGIGIVVAVGEASSTLDCHQLLAFFESVACIARVGSLSTGAVDWEACVHTRRELVEARFE